MGSFNILDARPMVKPLREARQDGPPPPPHGQGDSSERFTRYVFAASILGLFSLAWASSDEAKVPALRALLLNRGQHPASNYLNHLHHVEGWTLLLRDHVLNLQYGCSAAVRVRRYGIAVTGSDLKEDRQSVPRRPARAIDDLLNQRG